jgi:nitrogen regulatory protein P-II 2
VRTVPLKLVTIVAEAVLEERLVRDIRRLGARGYTASEARGEGSRGLRPIEWEGKNVKIETLVGPETAERILACLADHYFPHYAVVAYVENVEVVRGDKYL